MRSSDNPSSNHQIMNHFCGCRKRNDDLFRCRCSAPNLLENWCHTEQLLVKLAASCARPHPRFSTIFPRYTLHICSVHPCGPFRCCPVIF